MSNLHALCQAAQTGAKSIEDFETFQAWKKQYWRPIMRFHYRTYGPPRDIGRKPQPVIVPEWILIDAGWHYYHDGKQGYWNSTQGFWYHGTRDGLSPADRLVTVEGEG